MAEFNAVTLEMIWTRLISIVDEAAAALVRTSFSTIVRESNDFACVITDARGQSIAQANDSIPSFIGTVPRTIRHFLAEFPPETLEPGDILITNDIWQGTGHLPDITVAKPVFLNDRIVAFAGSVAHAPDIGGKIRSAESREVFEEGLQIPIMKVMRRGEIDQTFERFVRKNVRVPDQVMGDLYAQFTGLHLMEQRLIALMQEQGLDSLEALADEIHSRSEIAIRNAIRALPDGVYEHTAVSDGFAEPITLRMKMTVKGDSLEIDYAGSAPQVLRSINVCLAYTIAYTAYGVKAVLSPEVPNNDGVLRPITITAPEGCILNSKHPAAGGARALIGHFLPMMVISALAKAMPDKVIATVGSPLWCLNISGVNPEGRTFANLFFHERRLRCRARPGRRKRALLAEQHLFDAGRDDRKARAAQGAPSSFSQGHGRARAISRRHGSGDLLRADLDDAGHRRLHGRAHARRGCGRRHRGRRIRRAGRGDHQRQASRPESAAYGPAWQHH